MKKFVLISEDKLAKITSEPIQYRISEQSFIMEAFEIDELEYDCKKLAMLNYQNICITDDWYEDIFYEAEEIGVKIISFQLGKPELESVFEHDFLKTCEEVFSKYMPESDIYKLCVEALADYSDQQTPNERDLCFIYLKKNINHFYYTALFKRAKFLVQDKQIEAELKKQHILFNADGTNFFTNEN